MDSNRTPNQALQYKPKERRNIGRPGRRWNDQLHIEGYGTVTKANPSELMMMMMMMMLLFKQQKE